MYARLSSLQGQVVPTFDSSVTFSVPQASQSKLNLGPAAGPLPALAMEFIDAWTLGDLGQNLGSRMTDHQVQDICTAVWRSFGELDKLQTRHNDSKGINVIIRPLSSENSSLEIQYMARDTIYQAVIIDFGISIADARPVHPDFGDINDLAATSMCGLFCIQVKQVQETGPRSKAHMRQFCKDFADVGYHL